jgi:chromosome partitioning protein
MSAEQAEHLVNSADVLVTEPPLTDSDGVSDTGLVAHRSEPDGSEAETADSPGDGRDTTTDERGQTADALTAAGGASAPDEPGGVGVPESGSTDRTDGPTNAASDAGGPDVTAEPEPAPASDADWPVQQEADEAAGGPAAEKAEGTDPGAEAGISAEDGGHDDAPSALQWTPPPDAAERPDPGAVDVSRETSVDTPIAVEALRAATFLEDHSGNWPRPPDTRVITVSNQKGGVGKTTTVVNLAAAMAMHGLRVVVVDLDPQGNASTALGVDHPVGVPSTYDVILSGRPLSEVLVGVPDVAGELRCAPATIDLAGAELELSSQVAREYRLQRAIAELLDGDDRPDYLLVDSPPSLGLLTLNALVAAREVLIPIQCEYYALEGLAQLLGTIDMVQSYLNQNLRISTVLLTMYDSRTRLADQVAADVRDHFTDLVVQAVIPRNVRVSEAPGYGQTVMTYDPGSRGAISYLEAARELAGRGARQVAS